jgi:hypothetical protein
VRNIISRQSFGTRRRPQDRTWFHRDYRWLSLPRKAQRFRRWPRRNPMCRKPHDGTRPGAFRNRTKRTASAWINGVPSFGVHWRSHSRSAPGNGIGGDRTSSATRAPTSEVSPAAAGGSEQFAAHQVRKGMFPAGEYPGNIDRLRSQWTEDQRLNDRLKFETDRFLLSENLTR